MTDPKYMPAKRDRDGWLFKLIEEMGETNAAIGKAGRWGMGSYDPTVPIAERETNAQWILRELLDVEEAIVHVRRHLEEYINK